VFLESSWWAGFIGIYLVIQNVGNIDFKLISAAENSNKFQKSRFWKEKSVEDALTLGPMTQTTHTY
jgi:hypothetical protein